MTLVRLWHKREPSFMPVQDLPTDLSTAYDAVCEFDVAPDDDLEACEWVFAWTQNLDEAWCDPPKRSTSVGDLLEIVHPIAGVGTAIYQVDMIGMRLMSPQVV
jgi:hypothetical protein